MEISATVLVVAPPGRVWSVLTALDEYERWNPFMIEAAGTVVTGGRFTATFRPPGARTSRLRPTFTAVETNRRLAWTGHVIVPGLFDADHEIVLSPAPGGTEVTQRERFRGLLLPALRGTVERTGAGFRAMNAALAERASAR